MAQAHQLLSGYESAIKTEMCLSNLSPPQDGTRHTSHNLLSHWTVSHQDIHILSCSVSCCLSTLKWHYGYSSSWRRERERERIAGETDSGSINIPLIVFLPSVCHFAKEVNLLPQPNEKSFKLIQVCVCACAHTHTQGHKLAHAHTQCVRKHIPKWRRCSLLTEQCYEAQLVTMVIARGGLAWWRCLWPGN